MADITRKIESQVLFNAGYLTNRINGPGCFSHRVRT